MKKNYRKLVAPAVFVLALSAAVLAQDFRPKVRADIPFNFYAGSRLLPAGTYIVSVSSASNSVAIYEKAANFGTLLLASHIDGSRDGRVFLVFRTNGEGTYALEKVEGPGLGLGFSADKVKSHLALNSPGNETQVVIAAFGN